MNFSDLKKGSLYIVEFADEYEHVRELYIYLYCERVVTIRYFFYDVIHKEIVSIGPFSTTMHFMKELS